MYINIIYKEYLFFLVFWFSSDTLAMNNQLDHENLLSQRLHMLSVLLHNTRARSNMTFGICHNHFCLRNCCKCSQLLFLKKINIGIEVNIEFSLLKTIHVLWHSTDFKNRILSFWLPAWIFKSLFLILFKLVRKDKAAWNERIRVYAICNFIISRCARKIDECKRKYNIKDFSKFMQTSYFWTYFEKLFSSQPNKIVWGNGRKYKLQKDFLTESSFLHT